MPEAGIPLSSDLDSVGRNEDSDYLDSPVLEVVPSPPAESEPEGGGLFSNQEFQKRVDVIMQALNDPEKGAANKVRLDAEVHTYLYMLVTGLSEMQEMMATSGGPMGMIKAMMKRG